MFLLTFRCHWISRSSVGILAIHVDFSQSFEHRVTLECREQLLPVCVSYILFAVSSLFLRPFLSLSFSLPCSRKLLTSQSFPYVSLRWSGVYSSSASAISQSHSAYSKFSSPLYLPCPNIRLCRIRHVPALWLIKYLFIISWYNW